MKRELRDELEVPGHVLMIQHMTHDEAINALKAQLAIWEKYGYKKLNDVPEGESKERFRQICKGLGLHVSF